MSSPLRVLPCALLAGALLVSASAEARFGKSSDSSESRQEPDSRTHDASPVTGAVHDASPVTEDSGSSGDDVHDASPDASAPPPQDYVEPTYSYVTSTPSHSSGHEDTFASRRHRNFTLGIEAQAMREGAGVGLHLGLEGERFGGFVRASALSLRADDGSGVTDDISVTELHLSMAVLKGWAGRVRVEGGLSIAKAPDVTFVGPSVGLSSELYLGSSLSLEARVQLTPWPYRQLDAAGGLAWYFGDSRLLALRGGMRMLVLNDAGKVDGVVHQDVLPGPYLSFGLAI
ncbi:hypothetical protein ATI61_11129 [Archangium gephyra]|uniref:Outer membrane protein beta-barrel domain-containing protein n=1 Tax=Archangium gephyra TaxID=48 RepID=A0AAC8QGJ4_9BACT|nr:hypothetical protein [Archangium gephyra]AKJ07064.1 Hypothetical protein AA314_08690 [Archangium gephyra]REG26480.1 hypothetical protein ATI61_11129 [Archangium gephyra]